VPAMPAPLLHAHPRSAAPATRTRLLALALAMTALACASPNAACPRDNLLGAKCNAT